MKFSIILCTDNNYAIGYKNSLPWKIKDELKYFNKITTINKNSMLIMGRKTADSISNILKDRVMAVISTQKEIKNINYPIIFNDIDSCFNFCLNLHTDIFVIGGNELIKNILQSKYSENIDNIYLTKINYQYEADTYLDKNIQLFMNNCDIITSTNKKCYCEKAQRELDLEFLILKLKYL